MTAAIEALTAAVDEIADTIQRLPEREKGNQAWGEGVYGPKEVLAQLTFYHELYVEQMEALQEGKPFDPPQGSYEELNRQAVEANRVTPADALAQRLRAAQARLAVLYRELDPDKDQVRVIREAKELSLRKMAEQEASYIHRQLEDLQRGRTR